MAMSIEQVAKELEKLGKYQELLATILHWLETQGTFKPMKVKEKDDLAKEIRQILPDDILELVEEGISNQRHSTMDHSPHDPGDETD